MMLSMIVSVVFLVVVSAALLLAVAFHRLRQRPAGAPPGPPVACPRPFDALSLPWYGNIGSLRHKDGPHVALKLVADTYGDVASLKLGSMFTVVLSSADAIHEALVLKSTDFAGRVMLPTTRILSMDGQDLVFSDYNASWKMQRKLAHAALFNQKKLRGNSPAMLREISKLVDGMTAESQQCPSSTVCVRPLLRLTSMNIIARLVMSHSFTLSDPEFHRVSDAMATVFRCLGAANTADYLDGYPSLLTKCLSRKALAPLKEMKRAQKVLLDLILHQVAEHKSTLDASQPRDFIDTLLIARALEAKKAGTTPEDVFSDMKMGLVCVDLFLAGTDTSSTTVEWLVGVLASNSDLQQQMKDELHSVLPAGEAPQLSHTDQMPLLHAAIKETLRFRTVVPITRRTTTRDTTLRGYRIPKGTLVLSNVWAVHNDPKTYPRPEVFDATRFLDMPRARELKVFLPFGVGTRQCTGMNMGLQEVALLTATLLKHFTFSPPPSGEVDLRAVYAQTMHPRTAYKVTCVCDN